MLHQENLSKTSCLVSGIHFAAGDWHAGVIDDFTATLTSLNHSIVRYGRRAVSKYYPGLNKKKGVTIINAFSEVLQSFKPSFQPNYNDKMAFDNYEYYRYDIPGYRFNTIYIIVITNSIYYN